MPISYLLTLEQLSVLAHFSGINAFAGLPELPAINRERCDQLLPGLSEHGMLQLHGNEAAVDLALGFILSVMAKPGLVLQTPAGALGYCTRELGVEVSADTRAPGKYRVTPLPTARELADRLWGEHPGSQHVEFSIRRKGQPWEKKQMTGPELEAEISQIYTEVAE